MYFCGHNIIICLQGCFIHFSIKSLYAQCKPFPQFFSRVFLAYVLNNSDKVFGGSVFKGIIPVIYLQRFEKVRIPHNFPKILEYQCPSTVYKGVILL